MDLAVYLISAGIPVVAALRGVGTRRLWISLAVMALVVSAAVRLKQVDAGPVTKELAQFSTQRNVPVQTPQPASPACQDVPGQNCATPSVAHTNEYQQKSKAPAPGWPLGVGLSASLGFLLAGIFSRKPKEEPAPAAAPSRMETAIAERAEAPPANGLTITQRRAGSVMILDLSGRLVLGHGTDALRKEVLGLLAGGTRNILINMESLAKADSAGIGVLVEVLIQTTKEHGKLKLLSVPRMIHNVLAVHRLLPVFEMLDDEEKALASFE